MSQVKLCLSLVGCVILLAGTVTCQKSGKEEQSSNQDHSALWISVSTIPGYPLPDQKVPPTEGYEVTKGGGARKTINGVANESVMLSKSRLDELKQIILTVRGSSVNLPLDSAGVVLEIRSVDKGTIQVYSLPTDTNSAPVQALTRLRGFFELKEDDRGHH